MVTPLVVSARQGAERPVLRWSSLHLARIYGFQMRRPPQNHPTTGRFVFL
jgi:hypothetical protein